MFLPVTLGPLGMSIATDLGICGALGVRVERDTPIDATLSDDIRSTLSLETHKLPLQDYAVFMVNLLTLIRNAHNSFPKEAKEDLTPDALYETVIADIQTMDALLAAQVPSVERRYFANHYGDLLKRFPRAYLRTIKTTKQQEVLALQDAVLHRLVRTLTQEKTYPTDVYKFAIHPKGFKKTLMMTHIPFDLLSHARFNPLVLLESHTGVLKDRSLWYTKFTNRSSERVPVNAMTLQILGDGNNFLALPPKKLQDYLIKLANDCQWTYMTTKDKILSDVKRLHDPVFETLVKDMFKSAV